MTGLEDGPRVDRCPECDHPIVFYSPGHPGGLIRPHRDETTGEPCPAEGLTLKQAQWWVQLVRAGVVRCA